MEEAIEMVQAKDAKERMGGVERLQQILEHSRKSLTASEVSSLVDASLVLLKDNNFRVSQGALQALASAAALSGEHLKLHFNALIPAIVERLGDGKQPVRDAARRLLLALMEVSSPTIIVERAGSYAWTHKNWRVREEFARTVASAISLFAASELPFQRLLLPYVLQLLEDSNNNAREAAMACFEEMYHQGGPQFRDELQRHHLRPSQLKDINARLEKIEPKMRSFDGMTAQIALTEVKSSASLPLACNKRSSPKAKAAVREASLSGVAGDNDVTEKPVDPIKVYSEKELMREIDKIAGMLTPEQDWSVRIAAMQRVEGLVFGGAPDYACFPTLIKQLVGPLSVQLSDRRSSIVKQACHLLSLLSKELLGDFESCAESFIPVLFKLVVITVLVIAESADNCIKTMLRNCKVARILPRIVDCAKHDRSAVLRARCCEYALLVLEYWADAPEIQRSADLYEDLIKCCVGDAMSEVRSMARTCYRMFAKTWPDRSRRLFANFDPVIQRLINEEEGGIHKRYSSPSIRDRGQQQLRNPIGLAANTPPASIPAPGYGTSAIVAMDRSASLSSVSSLASTGNLLMSQRRAHEQVPERSLESVLQASKQQVSAIESMLRGLDASEKGSGSTAARPLSKDPSNEVGGSYRRIQSSVFAARTGVDPPSARDPPFPAAASATNQITARTSASTSLTSSNIFKGGMRSGVLTADLSDVAPSQVSVSTEVGKAHEASSALTISYSAKRVPLNFERLNQRSSFDENNDMKAPRRVLKLESQMDKLLLDTPYKDTSHKESQYSSIPNFQRPLLRKYGTGRSSGSNRISIEDNQLPIGEIYNYMDGLMSLNDALTEGLSSSADWSARVAAFNYLRKLLQQGPRGIQDVTQSFEKVMKLFFQHLDDPHHKVAQAALSTLAELVPACRKPFEGYLERILPHVFSRLVDPKELIRQLCSSTLEIVGNTYSIESVLPALLRSLDEQRSPKAKVAVIEFAIASFTKLAMNGEASGGSGLLKLWLAKLAPLANDKNTKLKETAVTGIISVYSHFDSTSVLNFILGLSIEEQSTLRRALKQYTPRIEVDLMNFLQSKNQRSRSKSLYDQSDVIGTSSEEGYVGSSTRKTQFFGRYSSGSIDSDNGRKWSSVQEPLQFGSRTSAQPNSEELQKHFYQNYESSLNPEEVHDYSKSKDSRNSMDVTADKLVAWSGHTLPPILDARLDYENSMGTPRLDSLGLANMDPREGVMESHFDGEADPDAEAGHEKADHLQSKHHPAQESGPSIPSLLHQMCDGNDEKSVKKKREALQVLVQVSKTNEASIWSKYFNQILTGVLEVLDDPDSTVRELSLAVIVEMLSNQKDTLEDSVEILLEKLLHATKDLVAKVSSEADRCATIVLSQYDPYRCLTVVVPLLVSEDEKTLVTCISCLTKLVGRLPPEELMAQLPSFLPALFDAFGNQSADVRKTVVFCLVDIYIVLGKAFLPYLGSLSSTQLRLVTIYANRISQARSGATLDSNQA